MIIRPAAVDDAAQIAAIYAPSVENSHVSFEERAPTPDEVRERIRFYTRTHPWIVAASDDAGLLAYAYACPHRSRPGYRWSVDTAIYVREDAQGQGIGKALYAELFRRLTLQRFHSAFAGIALPNDASIALHRAVGFTPVGIYRKVGYKNGAWHDTSWWELQLERSTEPPAEPLLPSEVRE